MTRSGQVRPSVAGRLPSALVVGLLVTVLVSLVGCGRSLEARRSVGGAGAAGTVPFETPRRVMPIDERPEVGAVSFRGTIQGRSPAVVVAPSDGFVSETRFAPGDEVAEGDVVMRFSPAPTRAQELEREIAELELELANEVGDDGLAEAAARRIDAVDEAIAARGEDVRSPRDGVVQGTRVDVNFFVDQGDPLFEVSADDDLVVIVTSTDDAAAGLEPGAAGAAMTVDREILDVELTTRTDETNGRVALHFDLLDSSSAPLELGGSVQVMVDIEPDRTTNRSRWVPLDVLHRGNGQPFLLIARPDNSLRRVDLRVLRRTDTHAEVDLLGQGQINVDDVAVLP